MLKYDYEQLANGGANPERLANLFLEEYYEGSQIEFPVNPFEMIRKLGIVFSFKPFEKYDGIYVPAEDENDIPVIGINLKRPITRQRYTAAHELCHHLKDSNKYFVCLPNSQSNIEKYAEKFAGELLMPLKYLKEKAKEYENNGYVDFEDVVKIADYFGVSFQACVYRLAYRLHMIKGDTGPAELKKRIDKFKPNTARDNNGYNDVNLYSQLFDCYDGQFMCNFRGFAYNKFKNDYIYYDSRMEGVDIDHETAAEVVTDLRLKKSESKYCLEENKNIIEVAGLSLAYDYAFDNFNNDLSISQIKEINKCLYSTAPYPEFGGEYRQNNPIITGSNVETVDCYDIIDAMYEIDDELQDINANINEISISNYLKRALKIHHRLTVIHAFSDGNGRTYRVFLNMMLLKKGISPTFFASSDKKKLSEKELYKNALAYADKCDSIDRLFEVFCKNILKTDCDLAPKAIL